MQKTKPPKTASNYSSAIDVPEIFLRPFNASFPLQVKVFDFLPTNDEYRHTLPLNCHRTLASSSSSSAQKYIICMNDPQSTTCVLLPHIQISDNMTMAPLTPGGHFKYRKQAPGC